MTTKPIERMNGYGSIPKTAHETAIDIEPSLNKAESGVGAGATDQSSILNTTTSSSLSKLGFVLFGFLLGYLHVNVNPAKWGGLDNVDSSVNARVILQQQDPFSKQKQQQQQQQQQQQHAFPGRFTVTEPFTFMDSLPFEEVYPRRLWNPVQIPPITDADTPDSEESEHSKHSNNDDKNNSSRKGHDHKHHNFNSDQDEDLTTLDLAEEASKSSLLPYYSYLKSLLVAPTASFLNPTTSISTKAHILYLANEAAFSLLYDNSNTKNYYLSEYSLDYFLLTSGGFDAQINQAYCAVASVAALLNSLKYSKRFRDGDGGSSWTFDLPVDSAYDPYPYATQNDILKGECVQNTVVGHTQSPTGDIVYGILKPPYGLNLEQTTNLIKCHTSHSDWDVTFQPLDSSKITLSKMRYDLKAALIDPDARVMINYDRKALNQVGGGHYSPLGAYHAPTDAFLVMDVAKYKYPPVWVGADTLFDAMATVDDCGVYDFPTAQDGYLSGGGGDPGSKEEYVKVLDKLGCEQRMRGYIVLKKKG